MQVVTLDKKTIANISLEYGSKKMTHLRNAPPVPHATMTVTVKVCQGDKTLRILIGTSYCSPYDSFDPVKGYKTALARALANDVGFKKQKPIMNKTRRTLIYRSILPKLKQILNPKKSQKVGILVTSK